MILIFFVETSNEIENLHSTAFRTSILSSLFVLIRLIHVGITFMCACRDFFGQVLTTTESNPCHSFLLFFSNETHIIYGIGQHHWWQPWNASPLIIIIAAVAALLLMVIIICCIIICICRKRRQRDKCKYPYAPPRK